MVWGLYLRKVASTVQVRPQTRIVLAIVLGAIGIVLIYFGITQTVFFVLYTTLGVAGIIAMLTIVLKIWDSVRDYYTKREQKKSLYEKQDKVFKSI